MRTLTTYQTGNRATIFLEGEIDLATAPAVAGAVNSCLHQGITRVDIDLARLTFCGASGVNAFLTAARSLEAGGGSLRLRHPTTVVRRVLDITGAAFLLDRPGAASPSAPRARGDEPVPPAPGRQSTATR